MKQELTLELKDILQEKNSKLLIGIAANGARSELMGSIKELKKKFPNLTVSVTERTSLEVERLVASGELDIGFVSLPIENQSLHQDLLYEEYVLVAAPSGSLYEHEAHSITGCPYPWIDIRIFKGKPFVLQNSGTRFRNITDRLLTENGLVVDSVMTTRNKLSALEFSTENGWYCFTTSLFIRGKNIPSSFRFFTVGTPIAKAPIGLIYRKGTILASSAKILTNILIKRLRNPDCS